MKRNNKEEDKEKKYSYEEQEIIYEKAKDLSHKLEKISKNLTDNKDGTVRIYIALELVQDRIRQFVREQLGEIDGTKHIEIMDRFIEAHLK